MTEIEREARRHCNKAAELRACDPVCVVSKEGHVC
jgi:hypothetical protein